VRLFQADLVAEEECLRVSADPDEFLRMIGRGGADDPSGGGSVGRTSSGATGPRR
jgi:hypothetical protein